MNGCLANIDKSGKGGYAKKLCIKHYQEFEEVRNGVSKNVGNYIGGMITRAKSRALEKGLDFSITSDDIYAVWPVDFKCPYLHTELIAGKQNSNAPVLDRRDSNDGYTPSNIQILSNLANNIKSSATEAELKTFFKNYF